MMQKIPKEISWACLLTSIAAGISALLVSVINKKTEGQYMAFYAQLVSMLFILVSLGTRLFSKPPGTKGLFQVNYIFYLLIGLLALASMVFLGEYPFASLGDEVRDGGLTMQQFLSGQIVNPLGYGRYDAHGLLLPEILSPFSLVFPQSELAFRVPATLLATVSVAILFLVGTRTTGKLVGTTAALILLTTPIHLFYARTEPVVIVGSLLVSMLLFLFTLDIKDKYYLLINAYVVGLSMNFHASLRPVAIIALAVLITSQISFSRIHAYKILLRMMLVLVIFIVGFGPRIIYTPPTIFFHTSRLVKLTNCPNLSLNRACIVSYASYLFPRYIDSQKVWFSKPTTSWYPYHQPIYPKVYFPLFLLGIFVLFRRISNKPFKRFAISLLLTIPLTNSAITDMVNADHRLLVIVPLAALIIGLGLEGIGLLTIKRFTKLLQIAFFLGLVAMSTFRVGDFFVNKRADKSNRIIDYLFMHTIELIKNNPPPRGQTLTVSVSPENAVDLKYLHYQEQRQYFTPYYNYIINEDIAMAGNKLVIGNGGKPIEYRISCAKNYFYCPYGYSAGFVVTISN